MEYSKEECDNLQVMCQALEAYWTQTKQAISEYRERVWNCMVECWEIRKECKQALLYFMEKATIVITEK